MCRKYWTVVLHSLKRSFEVERMSLGLAHEWHGLESEGITFGRIVSLRHEFKGNQYIDISMSHSLLNSVYAFKRLFVFGRNLTAGRSWPEDCKPALQ